MTTKTIHPDGTPSVLGNDPWTAKSEDHDVGETMRMKKMTKPTGAMQSQSERVSPPPSVPFVLVVGIVIVLVVDGIVFVHGIVGRPHYSNGSMTTTTMTTTATRRRTDNRSPPPGPHDDKFVSQIVARRSTRYGLSVSPDDDGGVVVVDPPTKS